MFLWPATAVESHWPKRKNHMKALYKDIGLMYTKALCYLSYTVDRPGLFTHIDYNHDKLIQMAL